MRQLTEYQRKRDFSKTREPRGDRQTETSALLRFVVQKHSASHLHFDFRLELDGVMKSWAVPKGPSLDPAVRRLAMEVEDHPVEYNTFEGTIPAGEYGGGTVMLWDRGVYTAGAGDRADDQELLRQGYTEPRGSREHLGALLLGYFDKGHLIFAGHAGGGFDRDALRALSARLRPLERKTSPFSTTPKTNEPAHWVTPSLVVEVKFGEWTADGRLRQPIYLGTRDDKDPAEVVREQPSVQPGPHTPDQPISSQSGTDSAPPKPPRRTARHAKARPGADQEAQDIRAQLDGIEHQGPHGGGTLILQEGATLKLTHLGKIYFPQDGYTKGDLMRYYATVAPVLLPALADRPLVLRRFPDGIHGESFYQQRAPEDGGSAVRVETIESAQVQGRRLIGGDLATALYAVQLGCVSFDPWHSRAGTLDEADYAVLDLDPAPDAPFSLVVDVARWIRDELERLDLRAALKTSGATGLHIVVPLAGGTPNQSALLLAQVVAAAVAAAHPGKATVERALSARPAKSVYLDCEQNVLGKSVASVYSVRARPGAPVSTPLRWEELGPLLDPLAFTIASVPRRIAELGDLWGEAMLQVNALERLFSSTGGRAGKGRRTS